MLPSGVSPSEVGRKRSLMSLSISAALRACPPLDELLRAIGAIDVPEVLWQVFAAVVISFQSFEQGCLNWRL